MALQRRWRELLQGYEVGAVLLDGSHVTGLEVELLSMFASNTRTTGACRVHVGTGAAASSSGVTNASWATTMRAAAAASHQRRAMSATDGHDPCRQVDDQSEGVEHDQGLDRIPGHKPQQRGEPEHSDDQPADEKASPHDSRSDGGDEAADRPLSAR